ncbi:hypothetical protein FXN61_48545 [Lentzea sp. PSKA42]|uniref:Secreted protein n=1 Tax=Lentzea indica TaxID=2604800 RepID=A0ABX1FZZ5_9PSEU|nr:hypothetical protein [Lentzea indica]NKE64121.1 hypothetical protein [Lentzea indica]
MALELVHAQHLGALLLSALLLSARRLLALELVNTQHLGALLLGALRLGTGWLGTRRLSALWLLALELVDAQHLSALRFRTRVFLTLVRTLRLRLLRSDGLVEPRRLRLRQLIDPRRLGVGGHARARVPSLGSPVFNFARRDRQFRRLLVLPVDNFRPVDNVRLGHHAGLVALGLHHRRGLAFLPWRDPHRRSPRRLRLLRLGTRRLNP